MTKEAIYLFRAENGLVKIGRSKSPKFRLGKLKPNSPIDVELAHMSIVEDAATTEAELHQEFAEKRVRGEWFRLTEEDVASIRERYPTSDIPRSAGKRWILLGLFPEDRDLIRAAAKLMGMHMTQFFLWATFEAIKADPKYSQPPIRQKNFSWGLDED